MLISYSDMVCIYLKRLAFILPSWFAILNKLCAEEHSTSYLSISVPNTPSIGNDSITFIFCCCTVAIISSSPSSLLNQLALCVLSSAALYISIKLQLLEVMDRHDRAQSLNARPHLAGWSLLLLSAHFFLFV